MEDIIGRKVEEWKWGEEIMEEGLEWSLIWAQSLVGVFGMGAGSLMIIFEEKGD